MWLCEECVKVIQEAKRYHQKLKENGVIINEAGYFIVKEHLERLETEDLKMLLNDQKAFNAKVNHFYNGVFSAKSMHILYIREWIAAIAYEILSRRNGA
jgi:ATP-dependent protease Clp ATPase subunit